MKKYVVDRIENGKLVLECENGKFINIDSKNIPNAKETDIIFEENGKFIIDNEETDLRKKHIAEKQNTLFK